ncbi:MAG: biotin--[acetyl-CoA-carboxylase] ligase [Gemmatimonadaceae bacterium]|nr:biotin--[acetyl-CoA-carboxylase] ligase [Gemmatimonadaceae bacterium]
MGDHRLDGLDGAALAQRLGLPAVEVHARLGSTMDVAHEAAARGAGAGTLIIADEQVGGRGRAGRRWSSASGRGLWMTLIERPATPGGLDVLSLRCGLHLAEALDELAAAPVHVKWPNDLQVQGRKLAGILIEARWRDHRVEWVALGIGLNVVPAVDVESAGLRSGASRLDVLDRVIPAVRAAAALEGPMSADELRRYAARDVCVGRRIVEPVSGVVAGIGATGDLMVQTDGGAVSCRAGSLVFAEDR